jgi:hypothetical protein
MWFLLEYDRQLGAIVTMRTFELSGREQAEQARLDLEIELDRMNIKHEIVVLEAESEEALRLTHRRYFADWDALARSASSQSGSS